jgi:hypothetical protein
MATKPSWRLGMLVRPVIVEDDVNDLAHRHLGLDGIQETGKLLMPMTLHAAADDPAFQRVKRGEQCGCPVALVIIGHCAGPSLLQWQAWLGAVERLNLRFLIDREHDCWRRGIDIEPDDVAQLGGQLRVRGQLELTHPMRLQAVCTPDALHRGEADAAGLGHHAGGPMGRLAGRVLRGPQDAR